MKKKINIFKIIYIQIQQKEKAKINSKNQNTLYNHTYFNSYDIIIHFFLSNIIVYKKYQFNIYVVNLLSFIKISCKIVVIFFSYHFLEFLYDIYVKSYHSYTFIPISQPPQNIKEI